MGAITDNLEGLHHGDAHPNESLQYVMEKANVQFKSLNFIRGRSIQNAILFVDEVQNLSPSQVKTVITRCASGTRVVCCGNLQQIDGKGMISPKSSGLTYLVEKMKNFEGSAHVYLDGVVRSRLAEYAEENLWIKDK